MRSLQRLFWRIRAIPLARLVTASLITWIRRTVEFPNNRRYCRTLSAEICGEGIIRGWTQTEPNSFQKWSYTGTVPSTKKSPTPNLARDRPNPPSPPEIAFRTCPATNERGRDQMSPFWRRLWRKWKGRLAMMIRYCLLMREWMGSVIRLRRWGVSFSHKVQ